MTAIRTPWLQAHARRRTPRLRLFCFSYAGGGASTFRDWSTLLPEDIEVLAVQLPGRETRFHEPAIADLRDLIVSLADATACALEIPFATFGHSLGTLVSYEWVLELQRRDFPVPTHMIMSGRGAPHVSGGRTATHLLPDAQFVQVLREMQGTPEELLQDDEAMHVLLPQLRADFALAANRPVGAPQLLPCGLSIYGGLADADVPRPHLEAWQCCARDPIRVRLFPGGHFFLHSARHALLEAVVRDLGPSSSRRELCTAPTTAKRASRNVSDAEAC